MKNRYGYLTNNKVNIKEVAKIKRGFTLIELMISIALVSLVLVAAYSFLGTTNKFFNVNSKRADAQSQLRLIMDGLKKEVGTSSIVKITSNPSVTPGSTERMFYSGTTSGSSCTLLLKTTGGIASAFGNMQLKSFSITFSTSVATPKMLTVTMSTSEGYSLTGTILAPNVSSIGGVLTGNTITCLPALTVIPTTPTNPYNDLLDFEKNMFNIVDPNAAISFSNINFSPSTGANILIQGKTVVFSNSGNNIHGNIAIQADTLTWGSTATSSSYDCLLDVKKFIGSPNGLNSNNYGPDAFQTPSWNGVVPPPAGNCNWHIISAYPDNAYWSYILTKSNNTKSVKTMTVRTIRNDIDFTDITLNPTLGSSPSSPIHYFKGSPPYKIIDNKLPNCLGNISSTQNVDNNKYEYIICPGDLTIDISHTQNISPRSFDFKGVIYCNGTVTISNLDSNFSGIIIAKNFIVTSASTQNWNVSFNNNTVSNTPGDITGLTNINAILNKITTSP
ncbi:prepilin-type N-terminal cleavage/methylation domain-containing protein [Clostridium estertheticum]|uniref:PulJ/GspJ family protein n=1 Tax=Clostridium estertheticum TaxID=238834 RepID=UPI001C0B983F|nr:prepilin-type N-terminal cleavage/methylation domain-containing protein [Clostridium estertheticum]MBU3216749.1 prepilin-type N-terminal cleavage/methylation domain-containing protein [Clostridium estertheticum]WAG54285.1 prepilin-type N-terminal cleavage/methylation domain-containing protein [Clostridium estertheticum]